MIKLPEGKSVCFGGKTYRGEVPDRFKDQLPDFSKTKGTTTRTPAPKTNKT